jgi:outer membrane protein OmpA-like peptidoglycan-associated protein
MEKGGITTVAIAVNGYGAKNPVAPNTMADGQDNPAGRQKNRRVEIRINK